MVVHGGAAGDPLQLLEKVEKQRWILIASVAFGWGRREVTMCWNIIREVRAERCMICVEKQEEKKLPGCGRCLLLLLVCGEDGGPRWSCWWSTSGRKTTVRKQWKRKSKHVCIMMPMPHLFNAPLSPRPAWLYLNEIGKHISFFSNLYSNNIFCGKVSKIFNHMQRWYIFWQGKPWGSYSVFPTRFRVL